MRHPSLPTHCEHGRFQLGDHVEGAVAHRQAIVVGGPRHVYRIHFLDDGTETGIMESDIRHLSPAPPPPSRRRWRFWQWRLTFFLRRLVGRPATLRLRAHQ